MDHNETIETPAPVEDDMSAGKVIALIALHIAVRVAVALTVRAIVVKTVEASIARKAKKAQTKTN
jgi:hypothetical protein